MGTTGPPLRRLLAPDPPQRQSHPDGQVTYDTRTEPDGVLIKRCGNRRPAVCPSCSYEYRADAYQLVRAGITGGKASSHRSPATRLRS